MKQLGKNTQLTDSQLLAEVEEVIRKAPSSYRDVDAIWVGRATAIVKRWDDVSGINFEVSSHSLTSHPMLANKAYDRMMAILHQAQSDLRIELGESLDIAIPAGKPFAFFEAVRKMLEVADKEVFFIDPYIDAEFIGRYLPQIKPTVRVRILTSDQYMKALVPAAEAYKKETGTKIIIRSSKEFHDRHLIIDGTTCYQVGSSFKDAAEQKPTSLMQQIDVFAAVKKIYEDIWDRAELRLEL
jgi:hypothetical protein